MPLTVPTKADVEALHTFLQDRNEEEWQTVLQGPETPPHFETVRRLSNSHKLVIACTASALLHALDHGTHKQAAALWECFTSCGEQWQEHPAWNADWANPARAALLANLSRPKD